MTKFDLFQKDRILEKPGAVPAALPSVSVLRMWPNVVDQTNTHEIQHTTIIKRLRLAVSILLPISIFSIETCNI